MEERERIHNEGGRRLLLKGLMREKDNQAGGICMGLWRRRNPYIAIPKGADETSLHALEKEIDESSTQCE